jgi:hypothetical protein
MLDDWIAVLIARRWMPICLIMVLIAVHNLAQADKGLAKTPARALQGLFCNNPDQIDNALTHIRKGLSPRAAVGLVNHGEIVCTFVDTLHYVIDRPVVIQEVRDSFPLFKYEGTLVAVIVGNAVRPVAPPVRIFFAIPERLDDAPVEGRA